MTDFTIHCAIDPELQEEDTCRVAYVILIGGDMVYQVQLGRRQGMVLPSRFGTQVAGFLSFDVSQTSTVGLRRIEVREAFAGVRIGEMRGLRLFFDRPNQVVGLYDPAPFARRLARQTLGAAPHRFVFQRAIDRAAVGWMEIPRRERDAWPVRLFRRLNRSPAVKDALVWQGQLSDPDLDCRPFIAAATILHSDQACREA